MELLKRALDALDRLLFPRRASCVGCGDKSGCDEDWLCPRCADSLSKLWRGERAYAGKAPVLRRAAAYLYRAPVPGIVRTLKYGSVRLLAEPMIADMARAYVALGIVDAPLVVPAPMYPRRERKRGYNQAAVLSRGLAKRLGLPHAEALVKVRNTLQQARLSHAQRATNLRGSIAVTGDLSGRAVLLVDDVYTTGATVRVCAEALTLAGASPIYVLTYAVAGDAGHESRGAWPVSGTADAGERLPAI